MKKLFLAILLAVSATSAVASAKNPDVEFNGMNVTFDQPAVIMQNRTMVPVRKIFELMGVKVEWEAETRTVKTELNGRTVDITIDKSEILVDGKIEKIDAPARIVNNRTLVPLRAVSQSYGCKVEWEPKNGVASVFADWYIDAEKKQYQDELLNFDYFAGVEVIKTDKGVSLKSNGCSMTVTIEDSSEVTVNDEYISNLKNGLNKFSGLTLTNMIKVADKNAVKFGCYNKERTIHYAYAYKNGKAYDFALTMPSGAKRTDAEKLIYSMNDFLEKF